MSKNRKNSFEKQKQITLNHLNSHSRPVSRRDFIAQGLVAATGYAFLPTFATGLMKNIYAMENEGFLPTEPKFIVFDLAGGAGLCGNFLFGKAGGPKDYLRSYSKLGWNPKQTKLDERFGLPMPEVGVSKVLEGMLSVMSEDTQRNFRFGSLLHTSLADSSGNPLSAVNAIAQVTKNKLKIQSPLGRVNQFSGGNSRTSTVDPSYRAFFVGGLESLIGALAPVEALRGLSGLGLSQLIRSSSKLSEVQARKLLNKPLTEKQINYLKENYAIVENNMKEDKSAEMDPRRDQIFREVFGIAENTSGDNINVITAAMVMNHYKGICGPVVMTIGGCDYHDGTAATGDAKDREIGVQIGRVLESARRMSVPVFIQIITDGGIYSDPGSRVWRGDTQESASILGYYDPNKVPEYASENSLQIGAYTDGEGVDRSTYIGDSPQRAAYVAAANFLNISGRLSEYSNYFPGTIEANMLDKLQIFKV